MAEINLTVVGRRSRPLVRIRYLDNSTDTSWYVRSTDDGETVEINMQDPRGLLIRQLDLGTKVALEDLISELLHGRES